MSIWHLKSEARILSCRGRKLTEIQKSVKNPRNGSAPDVTFSLSNADDRGTNVSTALRPLLPLFRNGFTCSVPSAVSNVVSFRTDVFLSEATPPGAGEAPRESRSTIVVAAFDTDLNNKASVKATKKQKTV